MQNPTTPDDNNTPSKPEKVNGESGKGLNLKDGRVDKEDVAEVKKKTDSYARYMGAGFSLVAPILFGVALGWWLDKKFHPHKPLWIIICPVVMIVVSLYQFVRQFLKP